MKDFEEFRKILNNGLSQELRKTAMSKAKAVTNFDNLEGTEKLKAYVDTHKIANEYFSVMLLEKYHNWANE